MLTWLIRAVLLALLVIGILVGIVLVAEPELRLTPYRDTLSQRLSGLLGRGVTFNGEIQLKLGRHAALHMDRVQVADAEWADNDTLLSAGQVSAGIDLLALVSGKVHLEGIVLREIDIALEKSADGQANWEIGRANETGKPETAGDRRFSLFVEDVLVEQVRVQYRSAQHAEPLVLAIERLTQHARGRTLMLDGRGRINHADVTLAGQVGTLDALLVGRDIDLDLSASIDDTVMRLRGRLGDPRRLDSLDLEGGIRGPSLAELLATLGIDDAAGGSIDAHFVVEDHEPGLSASLRGNIGTMQLDVQGIVGRPAEADDLSLDLSVNGKDLSTLGNVLGLHGLPVEPYSLEGRVTRNAQRLEVTDAVITSGDSKVELSAELPAFPTLSGGTARIDVDLSELRRYAATAGARLPAGPLVARLLVEPETDGGSRLDAELDQAGNGLKLNGVVGGHPGYQGTRLAFSVDVPNVQQLNLAAGDIPRVAMPLRGSGVVTVDDQQQVLLTLSDCQLGDMRVEASGVLGRPPSMAGTDLAIKASGPSLDSFASAFVDRRLPRQPYRVEARLQGDAPRLSITSVQARVGEAQLRGDGPIGPLPRLHETDTRLELDIPRIADLFPQPVSGTWAEAGYRVQGQLKFQEQHIRLTDGVLQGDRIDGSISAQIADDLDPRSARVQVQVKTPALSAVLPAISGYTAPDAPMSLAVTVQPGKDVIDVRELDIRLADATMRASGAIGFGGTGKVSLKFEAKGPNLGQLGSFDHVALQAAPFSLAGTLRNQERRYDIDDLVLQLGDGRLNGRITVLAGKMPTVDIALESQGNLWGFLAGPADPAAAAEPETPGQAGGQSTVIPDGPIDLDALARLNGRLQLTARDAGYPDPVFPDQAIIDLLDLDVRLQDGKLALEKLHAEGNRGQVDLSGSIERQGNQAGMNLALEAHDFRFGILAAGVGLGALPAHRISVNLAGLGSTYRSLAASLNGSIRIEGGTGRTDNTRTNQALGRFTNDLISTLNPFRKSEAQTRIDCTAAAANLADGVLQLFPGGVIRTDKLDIAASGTIDLATERIDIQFRSVPREGLGISVAGVVQPYVKVGGTLSQPGMTLDAPKALLSGTAAVATGGLSILATSLLDRASGAINPCTDIMSKADSGKATSTLNLINIIGDAINRQTEPRRPSLGDQD